jgi:hypothetical protein
MGYKSVKLLKAFRKRNNPLRAARTREERRQIRDSLVVPKNRTYRRDELAWAAGLFEGEGCFSLLQGNKASTAGINMIDRDVIERFCRIVGFGRVYAKPPREAHHKMQWQWKVASFEYFQATVALLWPWLGKRRKRRALEILRAKRRYFAKGRGRGRARRDSNLPRPARRKAA